MRLIRVKKTADNNTKALHNLHAKLWLSYENAIYTRLEPGDFALWTEENGLELRRMVPEEACEKTIYGRLEYVTLFFTEMLGLNAMKGTGVRYANFNRAMVTKDGHFKHIRYEGFIYEPSTVFPGECYILKFNEECPAD